MIIKQLINKGDIWEDFLNFCLRSKPYLDFCCGSRIMRINAARRIFNSFCESSDVYACDDTSYIFNIELADYNCIQFAFTNHSKSNSQKVKAFHGIMDHIRNINGKYFVSENRRTFKVDFYKKWLDRYDKRVIIVNNKDESILWYNKEKMEKTLKVVGTNDVSQHLQDKIVKYDIINVESGINACVTQISIDDEKYLFDCKRISLREDKALIQGMISDDKTFVANIVLEFNP
jgi:transcription elongation factor Elf1